MPWAQLEDGTPGRAFSMQTVFPDVGGEHCRRANPGEISTHSCSHTFDVQRVPKHSVPPFEPSDNNNQAEIKFHLNPLVNRKGTIRRGEEWPLWFKLFPTHLSLAKWTKTYIYLPLSLQQNFANGFFFYPDQEELKYKAEKKKYIIRVMDFLSYTILCKYDNQNGKMAPCLLAPGTRSPSTQVPCIPTLTWGRNANLVWKQVQWLWWMVSSSVTKNPLPNMVFGMTKSF